MNSSANARFEALYRAHHMTVLRCVAHLGVPREVWPDIVQEVWITAARRIESLSVHPRAAAWLCSVARNHAMHQRRSFARRQRKYQDVALQPSRAHDDPFGEREAWDTLSRLLADCPLEQREVYLKVELHGMSAAEVAEELGISINTVNSRLRLTRNRLRESGPPLVAALVLLRARTLEAAYDGVEGPGAVPVIVSTAQLGERAAGPAAIVGKLAMVAMLVLSPSAARYGELSEHVQPPSPSLARTVEPVDSMHPYQYIPWANTSLARVRPISVETLPSRDPPRRILPTVRNRVWRREPLRYEHGQDLLSAVTGAFRAGRYDEALTLARRHREEYPNSQLSVSREVLAIRALCAIGSFRKSRALVRKFSREYPDELASRSRLTQLPPECR